LKPKTATTTNIRAPPNIAKAPKIKLTTPNKKKDAAARKE
jgi:hypothetical protein